MFVKPKHSGQPSQRSETRLLKTVLVDVRDEMSMLVVIWATKDEE
jgi:hypothetical protein